MKASIFACLMFMCFNLHAQTNNYNKVLADSLGADEYGMKMYTLVILKTGKTVENDKAKADSIFKGHMQNIRRLAGEGKLVIAGPLEKNDKAYEGIFILNAATTADAQKLLDTDPAFHAGLLDAELYGMYGSAALPMYMPYVEKVTKTNF